LVPQPLLLKLDVDEVQVSASGPVAVSPLMLLLGVKPRSTPAIWSFTPAVTAPVM